MSKTSTRAAGAFCWPELCSGDAAASKKFYSSLFGWEARDEHMPDGDYSMFQLRGQNVGGMYQMAEGRKQAGIRPHWNTYVAVTDADETAKKAANLGGKVLTQPFDAGGDRMANLEDPTGAKFSIWQQKKEAEPALFGEVGALCWSELYTRDGDKAKAFYTALFGWRPQLFSEGPMPYTVFTLPAHEQGIGGMIAMPDEMPGEPAWLPYFLVDDADKVANHTRELGGKTCNPPMDIPTIGRLAMLADSQGAAFAIIKPLIQSK